MTTAKILISACLLGEKVQYDGKDALCEHLILKKWRKNNVLVPLCPEMAGGLPTPRVACEIQGIGGGNAVLQGNALVISKEGVDNTEAYLKGAEKALALAKQNNIFMAILKARSPSCGNEFIYDGSYQRKTIPGMGVTAALLTEHSIKVFNEDQLEEAYHYFCEMRI